MNRFNIRVYGLYIVNNQILISEEVIRGKVIKKFPGGGVELGEGIADALKREWEEELNTSINILNHFYTTDFYQPSAFDNSQVISIYYLVEPNSMPRLPYSNGNETFYFVDISLILPTIISLPIDKVVAKMIGDVGGKSHNKF